MNCLGARISPHVGPAAEEHSHPIPALFLPRRVGLDLELHAAEEHALAFGHDNFSFAAELDAHAVIVDQILHSRLAAGSLATHLGLSRQIMTAPASLLHPPSASLAPLRILSFPRSPLPYPTPSSPSPPSSPSSSPPRSPYPIPYPPLGSWLGKSHGLRGFFV